MKDRSIFQQKYLVLDPKGPKRKSIALLTGLEIKKSLNVGPFQFRPVNPKKDIVLKHIRKDDPQRSVMQINYIDRRRALSMYVEPLEVAIRAFRTIQLLVDNWVGMSMIYHFDERDKQIGEAGSSRFETADTQIAEASGVLKSTQSIRQTFQNIYSAQEGSLERIIERFSRGCTEIKDESVLDFMIALEGTLGFKLRDEIRHRLSVRGSLLLSKNKQQREDYYNVFRVMYDIRSSIAHGEEEKFQMKKVVRDSVKKLGYYSKEWEKVHSWERSYIIADTARRITRLVLLEFVANPAMLNEKFLLDLELGLKNSARREVNFSHI